MHLWQFGWGKLDKLWGEKHSEVAFPAAFWGGFGHAKNEASFCSSCIFRSEESDTFIVLPL
jgi:hypothetical protein